MSPITRFKIIQLVYEYWLRDMIIEKCGLDYKYESLLEFVDKIIEYKERS